MRLIIHNLGKFLSYRDVKVSVDTFIQVFVVLFGHLFFLGKNFGHLLQTGKAHGKFTLRPC